jgi:uncharacterized integral membrane protein
MGVLVKLGDIAMILILLVVVIGGGIWYLKHRWRMWKLQRKVNKMERAKEAAKVDIAAQQ